MIVFCSAEGTVTKVLPSPVYQGSSLSGGLYFVAPFPSSNTVTVAFQLANGDFTTDYLLSPITENDNELQDVFDKLGKNYSVWEWQADNGFVTAYAGEVTAQFKVVYAKNGVAQLQTTASVVFTVQKGVEALPAAPPSDKQWNDLLALYTQIAADYTQLTADLKALGAPRVEPIAATVPLRDKNGNVKTNEPQADNDAANKKFVKDAIVQNIVQNAGASTDKVMSQKTVTDELNKKSNATNLEDGSAAGSLQQKSATYTQMIKDFEPNMAAYIIAKNGGSVPANLQAYLAALQSSTTATSNEIIYILDNRRNDINTVITNFKTLPSPYADYGIDQLIATQLGVYGIFASSELSNTVGEAGDVSAVFGSKNKVFAPGAFAGGVNSQAGDKGYPSETMGAFAYGSNVIVKSKWAMGFGKDLQNLDDYSAMFGKGDRAYKIDKDASAADQDNQRKYLDHLADAGGTVIFTGDRRVGVNGINKGSGNIIAGMSHYIGDKATNNAIFGSQNILGPRIGDSDNANNLISGLLHYIKASTNCGVFGQANEVYYCANSLIAGESLKASKVYRAFITGFYNVDKPDRYIIVGNGTSDAVRSNAFEVLKDGRVKVQTAPIENDDVVRKRELDTKVNSIGLANSVYATDSKSHPTSVLYSKDALVNTIVQRTANGRLKAADPLASDDVVTLQYVKANFATLSQESGGKKLYLHTLSMGGGVPYDATISMSFIDTHNVPYTLNELQNIKRQIMAFVGSYYNNTTKEGYWVSGTVDAVNSEGWHFIGVKTSTTLSETNIIAFNQPGVPVFAFTNFNDIATEL